jgi:1,4-dihydroxy-2-naphthoate octaprenyltransferase
MGGPRPIAYTPFGELTVFVFFGLIAAVGSYYIQTGTLGTSAWVTGSAIGLIAAAALAVNNIRDYIHDAEVGRRTLVVALGKRTAERVYQAALIAPYFMVVALALTDARHVGLLAVLLTLPGAFALARDLPRTAPGLPYNELLFRTFKLELLFGACFTIGALLPGLLPAVR